MSKQKTNSGRAPSVWEAFARRHAGQPFLERETLYSLTEPIIDAVKAVAPDFFSADQERFERDLARSASFGFFHRNPLGYTRSDRDGGAGLAERGARSGRAIEEMLRDEYRRGGMCDPEIRDCFRASDDRRQVMNTRQDAYTGWLVTNTEFRDDVSGLQSRWAALVGELGRFPSFPRWPADDLGLDTAVPDCFRDEFLAFYRRWGLERMLTWEWPVAMEPDLVGGMIRDLHEMSETGVVLFVPWYMVRGEKLNLQEVVRLARATSPPPHLRDWVGKTRRKQDEMGDVRYERLAWLYRFLELALRRRYPQACRRRAQRMDLALGRVIGRDAESLRKLRQEMQRALSGGRRSSGAAGPDQGRLDDRPRVVQQ
jgi:hypothetical protein